MSLRARLEGHLNSVWYATESPPLLYRGLERLHRGLAESRFHRPLDKPPVPLIVVGNLCAGGSGKTPTVMALVEALKDAHRVAVISRGYGGRSSGYPLLVEADSPVEESGDEALLIARATGMPVWVDPDRARAMSMAVEQSSAEVVISDDGLQHPGLPRSYEICLFDGARGIGNGHLIPAGPLRQPMSRLAEVDQVLIKGDGMDWPGASRFRLMPLGFRGRDGYLDTNLEAWRGRAVTAICGLANPLQFRATLNALGIDATLQAFPDHHRYRAADLAGAGPVLVTTAKDAIKFGAWAERFDLHVLEVRAELPDGLLDQLRQHIKGFA